MKTAFGVLIVILVISLLGNAFQWYEARENDMEAKIGRATLSQSIVEETARALKADSAAAAIHTRYVQRRASDSVALNRIKMRNKAKSKKVDSLRVPVQPLIDSIQALGAFVQAYDSLLAGKNEEIKQLEQRHIGQILDLQALVKEKTSQIMAQIAVSETLGQVVTNLEQDVKREKRKKNFFKVVSGVLAGGIVFLSLKE